MTEVSQPDSVGCYLRYRRDDPKAVPEGTKFSSIRYPWKRNVSREQAEKMRASMPDPSKFEVVEAGGEHA